MRNILRFSLLALCACAMTGSVASADWPSDPAVNLAIATGDGEQVIPLVASTSDGGVYIAWFSNASGNYDVYLQRLGPTGAERWPHGGIRVSNHPQDTALFGWDMIADSHDNAVIVFSDVRAGGDLDIYAYKIGPDGSFLWGADGVTLSDNPDFEPAPRVAEASDGDFVFVWQRDPSSGDGDIRMQRLSAAGVPRFASGGIVAVSEPGRDPGFVAIAPADNGSVVLCWLRDIRSFMSPRHLRARKYSAAGAPLWAAPVEVYNLYSLPLGYGPKMESDGAGGAILWWHRSDGSFYNSLVQHLDAAGTELFPHEGVEVSTTLGMHHLDPTLSRDASTGEIYVFWNERNSLQSQWGIFGQKLSPTGARVWAGGGVQLLPVDTLYKSFPRSAPASGGALVFLADSPNGYDDRLIGMRVDRDGARVWPGPYLVVSSAPGGKARYPLAEGPDGVVKIVWEDDRNGTVDVYGQNVNPNGTLGVLVGAGRVADLHVTRSQGVPGNLLLKWAASCSPTATDYAIYEGTIGSYDSHRMKTCTDQGGDLRENIFPNAGDTYYLVVPIGPNGEGSYGTDSSGNERPQAPADRRCVATQLVTPCP